MLLRTILYLCILGWITQLKKKVLKVWQHFWKDKSYRSAYKSAWPSTRTSHRAIGKKMALVENIGCLKSSQIPQVSVNIPISFRIRKPQFSARKIFFFLINSPGQKILNNFLLFSSAHPNGSNHMPYAIYVWNKPTMYRYVSNVDMYFCVCYCRILLSAIIVTEINQSAHRASDAQFLIWIKVEMWYEFSINFFFN